jgi:hypothetical protein
MAKQLIQLLPEIFYKLMANGKFLPNIGSLPYTNTVLFAGFDGTYYSVRRFAKCLGDDKARKRGV